MKKVVTVPALIVVAIVSTHAQDPVPLQSIQEAAPARSAQATRRPAFRTISSVVALNVTVTDGKKLVTGLTQDDFQVYEDGVQQEVRFFESRAAAADVIVVASAGADDWRARCMYLCLRHYARQPALPVVFLSRHDTRVTEQLARRDVWLLAGAYVVEDEPLLPDWQQAEMKGDPLAGTVTLMRYSLPSP